MLHYDVRKRDQWMRASHSTTLRDAPSCHTELPPSQHPESTARDGRRGWSHLAGLLAIFEVELASVSMGKCDRNKHDTLVSKMRENLEPVASLCTDPDARPHLQGGVACPGRSTITAATSSTYGLRKAAVDDGHWEGMRRREERNVTAVLFWNF
jgi:hypothetical protein